MVVLKRPALAGWVGVLALLAAGCGGQGDVTGRVTFKGAPVVSGTVTFYGPDKIPHLGTIDAEGKYTVTGVPTGACVVTVASPDPGVIGVGAGIGGKSPKPVNPNDPPPAAAAPKAERPAGWKPLPDDVGDPLKSKLNYTVKSGSNTIDIVIE